MSAVFVGTAGWSVPSRFAAAFPTAGSHLVRYAAFLPAAEINTSFYRPHRPATYARWAASVPDGFRFSVKLPKTITHERRLVACEDLLDRFAAEVAGLGTKLGVVLVQLPPSLAFEELVARAFLAALGARLAAPVAVEPRHASWFTPGAEACLAEERAARVAADPPPAGGIMMTGGWPGLAYLRLHGTPRLYYSNYDDSALRVVSQRLAESRAAGVPAWGIFDNTAAGHALGNALQVQASLDPGRPGRDATVMAEPPRRGPCPTG
jgi:uncharacterized protein YecE (DUF72 family)